LPVYKDFNIFISGGIMQIDTQNYAVSNYSVGASGDNEALERVPDNEQAEMASRNSSSIEPAALASAASLPEGIGQNINLIV